MDKETKVNGVKLPFYVNSRHGLKKHDYFVQEMFTKSQENRKNFIWK
jgi:hypothetical protein